MSKIPLLSLCIPTNGILDLIKPVIESIYSQNIDNTLFEVVVMDNGDNKVFRDYIIEVEQKQPNLHYFRTEQSGFLNELEAYKKSNGVFIKFINHRTKIVSGGIQYLLDFISSNMDNKPAIYFSNGVLNFNGKKRIGIFDHFVRELGLYNTWSTGIAFWKDDFAKIDFSSANELFPHTAILFGLHNKNEYIVDNTIILDEIPISHANKGRYDVFYAFLVEFNNITSKLFSDNLISKNTFRKIKKELLHFCVTLYVSFVIEKEPCSYDISNPFASVKPYYNTTFFKTLVTIKGLKRKVRRLISKNGK